MTLTTSTRAEDGNVAGHWILCPACSTPLYRKRFVRELRVCIECGRHEHLTAPDRLVQLSDGGRYTLIDMPAPADDPLGFVDTRSYRDRLAGARARTSLQEAVLCGRMTIGGVPLIAAVMDFRFLGGSLGTAAGEHITQAAELALAERLPLLIVTASGGARMQEGALALMQMAKTAAALGALDDAGVLTVSLIADPTFGGVAASFATLTDVIIAEPGARLGFAGRRVIEQTIRQHLPAEFQTAEFLLERGFVDRIVPRNRLRQEIGKLLRAAERTDPDVPEDLAWQDSVLERNADELPRVSSWEQVGRARALGRPTTLDYLALAFDDFQELHGDRVGGRCRAIVGGTAQLAGRQVVVIGHQKGQTPDELIERNFGMPNPAGYRTAGRLMRLADKLGLPVITLIDTPGAYPGADAEERGQAVAIAENLKLMSGLRVPVVSVVIGEGGSGGALALAVANRVLMFSNSVYSVISPEGCASIVWKDPAAARHAASALQVDARNLLRLGVVDGVLREPEGGTADAPLAAAELLRAALFEELEALDGMDAAQLRADRRARFRRFGSAGPDPARHRRPTRRSH